MNPNTTEITAPAKRKDYELRYEVEKVLMHLDKENQPDIIAALLELGMSQERAFQIVKEAGR